MTLLGRIAHIEAWTSLGTKDAKKIVVLDDSPPLQNMTGSFAMPITNPLSLICKILPPCVAQGSGRTGG